MASRKTNTLITIAAVLAIAVAGAFGLRALWNTAKSNLSADVCSVGPYDLDPTQAVVAATMVGAVTKYRIHLPERAAVLVLAAALQESKLTNLAPGDGDRDSVGVLQQRPSQGWGGGSAARLTDVGEATTEFLDALMKIPHWRTMPLADAIQAVQISADGSAYAQHEQEAQALADALQGVRPAGITCSFQKPTKVATSSVVAQQASTELGISTPRATSAHVVRAAGARWQTAAWFVANADRLGIERVAYQGKVWTRTDGWKPAPAASGAAVVATLYNLKQ
ncbi:MAG TPA: hypothetical protein VKB75_05130 [Jatrophihabitans sp.]|nr:hypothetical protein [Jatrophihabitans sp.]